MNANQLTKIPLEKLSDTLQFLIAENEIPLSDALKQVIDDVDAVCKKLLRDESAPAQPVIPEQALNPAKLINKFYERYPLETFAKETERAEALGYFMAGAELQCFGDFIAYDDHVQESE